MSDVCDVNILNCDPTTYNLSVSNQIARSAGICARQSGHAAQAIGRPTIFIGKFIFLFCVLAIATCENPPSNMMVKPGRIIVRSECETFPITYTTP